jgi:hypothetical protein
MTDPALSKRANDAFDRIRHMDMFAAVNARAFRALLEELTGRTGTKKVYDPHKAAIEMVRAAILRGAVGTLMSCLDVADRRDNRASIGQILTILEEPGVFAVWQPQDPGALQKVRDTYEAVLKTDPYAKCKALRNNDIGHLLHGTAPPTVEYADIFALHDATEPMVVELCRFVRIAPPRCPDARAHAEKHAKLFWDTYFRALP